MLTLWAVREGRWIPLTEAWVRGHWAVLHSLTVPQQYKDCLAQQQSEYNSVGEMHQLSLGQRDAEKKVGVGRLALCNWGAERASKKMWSGSNLPADCFRHTEQ